MDVFRFDADSWCVVHCRAHSDVVQMTSNLADEEIANQYAGLVRADGGHVFRVVQSGVLVAALGLIGRPNEVKEMRDVISRIATEYPAVVTPCLCGKGEACSKCEITFVLDEFASKFPVLA